MPNTPFPKITFTVSEDIMYSRVHMFADGELVSKGRADHVFNSARRAIKRRMRQMIKDYKKGITYR